MTRNNDARMNSILIFLRSTVYHFEIKQKVEVSDLKNILIARLRNPQSYYQGEKAVCHLHHRTDEMSIPGNVSWAAQYGIIGLHKQRQQGIVAR